MDADRPLSANERIKSASNLLRGTIADGLTQAETGSLADDDTQLTKFHGFYQQDDRDLRAERGKQRMEKAFSFMVRLRVPAGSLTPAQWLGVEKIALERANGTIRLTTRETIQYHGVLKGNLQPLMQGLHAQLLDTIAACGDVNRNVIATTDPWRPLSAELRTLARDMSRHLLPRTRAWHEIWLNEEKVAGGEQEDEPILGRTYLPRKFKIGLALPPHNDVDVFAQDLGFIAIVEDGRIVGYNVAVGGGMGMTHGEPETYPRVGDIIGFCPPEQAIEVAEKVVTVQRDYGDRSNRKHARVKYTIDTMGLARFVELVNERLGKPLSPARDFAFTSNGDRLGWAEDEDGIAHFTLFVENGRIKGDMLAALHDIATMDVGRFVMTPNQNLILADIPASHRARVTAVLERHGLDRGVGGLRRNAMACVALPTCGLALAESERYLPHLITRLEESLEEAGLSEDDITIRMTGCPNGCARPYVAEIGLVGRTPGVYNLYLGGAHEGARLNKLYRRDVGEDAIVESLTPLFKAYAKERLDGERFGDFVIRAGVIQRTINGLDFHENLSPDLRT
ncbi:MAG TPA: NADPH-dependent assimilatory sulfite reductase hemoprotein subunit [Rhodopila sp.]|uniref:NADPH-dependent assimilatory sulfite reductase hemoprotein subunit n=1 Tax=Rhodopila sp. TaxID=2480087 RepID=UPI002C25323D|nr:NADPH-dependent assimilatory sulfite reductase hemoprotein subunit [Rhodopila sp.]HVY17277.1 NADPH-dependent assimilatory sulfite reductase hemoprotein subunit [Rhodopila sp.]